MMASDDQDGFISGTLGDPWIHLVKENLIMSAFPISQSSGHSEQWNLGVWIYIGYPICSQSLVKITFSKPCFHGVIPSLAQKFIMLPGVIPSLAPKFIMLPGVQWNPLIIAALFVTSLFQSNFLYWLSILDVTVSSSHNPAQFLPNLWRNSTHLSHILVLTFLTSQLHFTCKTF